MWLNNIYYVLVNEIWNVVLRSLNSWFFPRYLIKNKVEKSRNRIFPHYLNANIISTSIFVCRYFDFILKPNFNNHAKVKDIFNIIWSWTKKKKKKKQTPHRCMHDELLHFILFSKWKDGYILSPIVHRHAIIIIICTFMHALIILFSS